MTNEPTIELQKEAIIYLFFFAKNIYVYLQNYSLINTSIIFYLFIYLCFYSSLENLLIDCLIGKQSPSCTK